MQKYKKTNLRLKYDGTILIARSLKEEFCSRYFVKQHHHDITFELDFEEWKLIKSRETSGIYLGFS